MIPENEAAVIVLACRDLDGLLKQKYMFFGGSFVAVSFLIGIAIFTLFFNENWFILTLSFPFLVWLFSDVYIAKLNYKIQQILEIIQAHHQHELLRRALNRTQMHNEVLSDS
jgi:hypothetical protein